MSFTISYSITKWYETRIRICTEWRKLSMNFKVAMEKQEWIETIDWGKKEKSYPTKNPAKCSNSTESMTTPNSLESIALIRRGGDKSDNNETSSTEDFMRTTFSENTLKNKQNARDWEPKRGLKYICNAEQLQHNNQYITFESQTTCKQEVPRLKLLAGEQKMLHFSETLENYSGYMSLQGLELQPPGRRNQKVWA